MVDLIRVFTTVIMSSATPALGSPEKCKAIEDHVQGRDWDRKRKKTVVMPETSDATATVSVAINTKLHDDSAN